MRGFLPHYSRADIIRRGELGGLTDAQIAAVLGIGEAALRHWRSLHADALAAHVPCDPRPSDTLMARLLVACGVRVEDAARVTGQLPAAVGNARSRAKIAPRYQPAHDEVVRDLRAGNAAAVVAAKYGLRVNSVYQIAHRYGVPLTDEQRRSRRGRKPIREDET